VLNIENAKEVLFLETS